MSVIWTLTYDGETKTLADWGLADPVRTRRSGARDTLTLTIAARDVTAADLFPYDADLRLYRDGVQWFRGNRVQGARTARAGEEQHVIEVAGPWMWLEELVYRQAWKTWDGGEQTFYKTEVLLNVGSDGSLITTGAQITAAIQYAIGRGAPITLGTVDTGFLVYFTSEKNIKCSEIIARMLRWMPDCATWFDYTTESPTLHVRRRANLTAQSLALFAGTTSALMIQSREDLQLPGVILHFEQRNTVDGVSRITHIEDKYPPAASADQRGTLCDTIDLRGATITLLKADVESEEIQANAADATTRRNWWLARLPHLNRTEVQNITVTYLSRTREDGSELDTEYRYELTNGAVAEWMDGWDNQPGDEQREVFSARFVADVYYTDDPTQIAQKMDQIVTVKVRTTNVASGSYQTVASAEEGEPVPTGLAQNVYTAASVLQWEGSVETTAEDVDGTLRPGQLLNLTGGRTEWESMAALIYEVTEDITQGITAARFGPVPYLGIGDLLDLLRMGRERVVYTRPEQVTTSEDIGAGGGSEGQLPSGAPVENSTQLWSPGQQAVWSGPGATGATPAKIDLNTVHLPDGKTAQFRKTKICDYAVWPPVYQEAYILMSAPVAWTP